MDSTGDCPDQARECPMRVLLAVHGHEPDDWTTRACRLASGWRDARLRVLALTDVSCPPFTSLIGPARRLYASACSVRVQDQEQRVQRVVDRVVHALPCQVEVVRERYSAGGFVGAIVEHAMTWAAEVVVLAAPTTAWGWVAHQRLLHHAGCAVLAIPRVTATERRARRRSAPRVEVPGGLQPAGADRPV